jgi:hypothetical protein
MAEPSFQERYRMGEEFQDHVKDLLSLSGYLEGQIYSTGTSRTSDHTRKLRRLGHRSYTSPDIMIANRWMDDSPAVEFRFGLACGRRQKLWDDHGKKSVTVPTYQRIHYEEMMEKKRLEIYMVFGHRLEESDEDVYAIGVTEIRKPDSFAHYVDRSTDNLRRNDIYHLEKLMSWCSFVDHRITAGDIEPQLENLEDINIPWIGDL